MPTNALKRADLLLLLFFVAYCAAVVLRVHVEATGYLSPDSEYYLEAARSLVAGEKFIIRDLYGPDHSKPVFFTAWPIGYPVLIAIASWIGGLSLFWASKVVNLLFVGFSFLLFRHINRAYSYVLASMYAAFTFIEIYSYTWSEGAFLFGCLCFAHILHNTYITGSIHRVYLLLLISVFLFLTRYIGFFAGSLILLFAFVARFQGRKSLSNHLYIAFILNVLFVLAYILHNYYMAGYNTDAQRLTKEMESVPEVLLLTFKGLLIELFLIRKYYLQGSIDYLTLATTVLQATLMVYIVWLFKLHKQAVAALVKNNILSQVTLLIALAYLLVITVLRSISQFDAPNYRLLSPVTLMVLFAVLHCLILLPDSLRGIKQAKHIVFAFFVISLILNLPKAYLLTQLRAIL